MTEELTVTDITTRESQKIAIGNAKTVLRTSFENRNPKKYPFEATVQSGLYQRKTLIYEVELENVLPSVMEEEEINLLIRNTTQKIGLNRYFKDENGDRLVY